MQRQKITNVIKRNGEEVHFDRAKIVNAITKANGNVERIHQMNPYQIEAIADTIAEQVQETPHAVNVEDIQDMVETSIMEMRGYEVAQKYKTLPLPQERNASPTRPITASWHFWIILMKK